MAGNDRWWDEEETEDPKEVVEEMLNEAEINRLRREAELAQAKHEVEIAKLKEQAPEAAVSSSDGIPISPIEPVADSMKSDVERTIEQTGGGVLGLWWLTPGEAFSIGIAAMLSVFFFGIGSIVAGSESDWYPVQAEVIEKYPGFYWIEHEECDDYECWVTHYELECWADLDISYAITSGDFKGFYSSELDHYVLSYFDDYSGAEDDCLEFAENEALPIGSFFEIYYNSEDPSEIGQYPPEEFGVIFLFCCLPIFLVILVITIVNARFSNAPKYVYDSPNIDNNAEIHHHHHGGFGGGRWGPRVNINFGRGVRNRRRGRRVSRSRSSRVISSGGGRRSGGGRSGGGGRR